MITATTSEAMRPEIELCRQQVLQDLREVGSDDSEPIGIDSPLFFNFGEFVERDMVAVRVSKEQRAAIVGAPSYFASHPKPQSPRDLPTHHCINFRHGSAGVYHWEFDKGRKSLSVAVNGQFTVDDVDILIRAAVDGAGLAFALEEHVATQLAKGTLVRVLEDWCPPFAGYFLYYPSRRQQAPALSALIEALRL